MPFCAHRRLEQAALDGVVHVDHVLVGIDELEFAQHIGRPWRLDEGDIGHIHAAPVDAAGIDDAAVIFHLEAVLAQDRAAAEPAAAAQVRHEVLPHDGRRHGPFRVEHDGLHVGGENRGRVSQQADDDLVGVNDLPVFHHVEHVLRDVVLNVDLAEILRHPPPALHVDDDLLDVALARRLARTVAAACLHQRLPQVLELLMLRMQRLEIGVGVGQNGDLGEHDLRVAYGRLQVEDLAEACRIRAAAAGVARIFQDGELKLDLGDSLLVGAVRQCAGRRKLEGGG